jgi:hypothetical protein
MAQETGFQIEPARCMQRLLRAFSSASAAWLTTVTGIAA